MTHLIISYPRSLAIIFCFLLALNCATALAEAADVSGTWESQYNFGDVSEVMTANIQQVGENILGSFSVVQNPTGEEYSGIIFGTIEGDKVKAYYLATRESGSKDPRMDLTFTDARLIDENTISGTYYFKNSDQAEASGDYEARKI
jgi:hypothetical protein